MVNREKSSVLSTNTVRLDFLPLRRLFKRCTNKRTKSSCFKKNFLHQVLRRGGEKGCLQEVSRFFFFFLHQVLRGEGVKGVFKGSVQLFLLLLLCCLFVCFL